MIPVELRVPRLLPEWTTAAHSIALQYNKAINCLMRDRYGTFHYRWDVAATQGYIPDLPPERLALLTEAEWRDWHDWFHSGAQPR